MSSWSLDFWFLKLLVFLVIGLSFLIDKLPPCLSIKQHLGKLLSQALDRKLYEILLLFLKCFHNRNLLFLFCTLHGSSQEREARSVDMSSWKLGNPTVHMWALFFYTALTLFVHLYKLLTYSQFIRSILTAIAQLLSVVTSENTGQQTIRRLCVTIVTLKRVFKKSKQAFLGSIW